MKSKIFVASSKEGLEIAYAVQENLEHDAEVTVWSQGAFEPSKFTLDSLIDGLDDYDFGSFVFSPDDVVVIRNLEQTAIRDNVVLELGMFIGRLGKERCFIVIPRGQEDLRLPTDLLGLTPVLFEPNRTDQNLNAALGPACNQMRKKIRQLGPIQAPALVNTSEVVTAAHDDVDALSIIETWMGSRASLSNERVIVFAEVDRLLKLKPGTAEKFIEEAAKHWHYRVRRRGTTTILFEDPKYVRPT
jgi:hypothetical protein